MKRWGHMQLVHTQLVAWATVSSELKSGQWVTSGARRAAGIITNRCFSGRQIFSCVCGAIQLEGLKSLWGRTALLILVNMMIIQPDSCAGLGCSLHDRLSMVHSSVMLPSLLWMAAHSGRSSSRQQDCVRACIWLSGMCVVPALPPGGFLPTHILKTLHTTGHRHKALERCFKDQAALWCFS